MRRLVVPLIVLLLASTVLAKTDIVIDPDYDPRIPLRVVVLPALKERSLKRVNERTVSAMLSTELLKLYEVTDLLRFEAALSAQRLSLDNAFTANSRETIRDVTGVDAVINVEVYRWEEGTGGIPFLGRKSGTIAMRINMLDPYTGRAYWSVNRLEDVKPGTVFLDRTTELFRDLVDELGDELTDIAEELSEADSYAELAATREPWQRMEGYSRRTYDGQDGVERGFMPYMTPEAAYIEAYRGYGYQPDTDKQAYEAPISPDTRYEDIEGEQVPVLPDMGYEAELYDRAFHAALDSLIQWSKRDSLGQVIVPPNLPPFELQEMPEDSVGVEN
ncbi:hypothetical protein KQI52_00900 [bacterium]|nr:hypothetical protein [bacterium]